ncbi:uncharacterized protein LOC109860581 [Pseudomyrmex gracilis]|uniref:uncharacterized protein LOC109860581 n=1 Tax=Pseudomyrmex gracilis TaxID=219809 RepID=UPI0009958F99|nr:uncharacterized protein LOC109860581 [Pseudomyrmex gracilis]XP_020295372.1 uncharacterized protein LOC109860581 [Pseudomyrmex gracilis]XP_020295373.1 uncharacterized protein LOC109860581 [Pseudomyrmex gracilis]
MNILKTEDGSYVSPELNEVDKAIYDIIGPQIDGLKNKPNLTYDDDQDNVLNCSSSGTEEVQNRKKDILIMDIVLPSVTSQNEEIQNLNKNIETNDEMIIESLIDDNSLPRN